MNVEFREGTLEDLQTLADMTFYNNGEYNKINPEIIRNDLTSVAREWFLSLALVDGRIVAFDIRLQRGPDWVALLWQDVVFAHVHTGVLEDLCEYANGRVAKKGFQRTQWGATIRHGREIRLAAEYKGFVVAYLESCWHPQLRQSVPVLFLEAPVDVQRRSVQAVRGRFPNDLQVTALGGGQEYQVTQQGCLLGTVQVSLNADHVLVEVPEQTDSETALSAVAVGKHLIEQGRLIAVPSHRTDLIAAFSSFGNYAVGFIGEGVDRKGYVMIQ